MVSCMPKKTTSHIFHFTNQLSENGMKSKLSVDWLYLISFKLNLFNSKFI